MNQNRIHQMLESITPDIYKRLLEAVETGKWADGVKLTEKQKEDSLQIVMLWQSKNNINPEHMSINTKGEIVIESKQTMKNKFTAEPIDIVVKS